MSVAEIRYKKGSEDYSIVKRLYDMIGVGVPNCEKEHDRCEENQRYVRGFQWEEGDLIRQQERERPALPMNSLIKLLNAVANREIMNRIVPKIFGRSEEDHSVAEVLDLANEWQRNMAETEHEESNAFRWACASGYGVLHKYWDSLALDGDGMIKDEEIPVWYMLWDPMSRKQNLVDRKWHICGKYVDYEEAKEVFGDISKQSKRAFKDMDKIRFTGLEDMEDRVASGYSGSWGQIRDNKWLSLSGKEIFVIEAEWVEVKGFWKVAVPYRMQEFSELTNNPDFAIQIPNPETGEPMQITGLDYSQMEEEDQFNLMQMLLSETQIEKFEERSEWDPIAEQYEAITGQPFEDFRKEKREVTKYAIMSDGVLLDSGERPMGFTYEFLTGFPFETRESSTFFGMVDVAKGPQDMKNVFYSHILTMYMTSPKQHLIVEEGAVHDVNRFMDEYARVSGVSFVPDGFFGGKRFEMMDPPHFPPMLGELINIAENAVQDIFGLSSIESGSQGDLRRLSTSTADAAKAATNTILANFFDALRRFRRRWGMLNTKYIMSFYEPSEIAYMVGDLRKEAATHIEAVSNMDTWPDVLRYDIKIDESPASISEQLRTLDYMTRTGLIDKWFVDPSMPFDEVLDLIVTIPQSKRDKLKQARAEKQQIMSQVQQMQNAVVQEQLKTETLKTLISTTVPGGNQILQQFEAALMLAQQMAVQMNEAQQQTEQQGA